ncbi:MAG: thioredoxin [Planctomycetaceae bacterium]|nr:thioredoxin [Planctomycetaceae bacterium]
MKRLFWAVGCLPIAAILAGCSGTEGPTGAERSPSSETETAEEGVDASSPSLVVAVNDANFERQVIMSEKPVLVSFSATWCGPCRAMAPVLRDIAKDYDGRMVVADIDIDNGPLTSNLYNVRALPTLILFHRGEVVLPFEAGIPQERISSILDEQLIALATEPPMVPMPAVPPAPSPTVTPISTPSVAASPGDPATLQGAPPAAVAGAANTREAAPATASAGTISAETMATNASPVATAGSGPTPASPK